MNSKSKVPPELVLSLLQYQSVFQRHLANQVTEEEMALVIRITTEGFNDISNDINQCAEQLHGHTSVVNAISTLQTLEGQKLQKV